MQGLCKAVPLAGRDYFQQLGRNVKENAFVCLICSLPAPGKHHFVLGFCRTTGCADSRAEEKGHHLVRPPGPGGSLLQASGYCKILLFALITAEKEGI